MIDDAAIKQALRPLAPHLTPDEWDHLVLIAAYIRPPDSDWRLQALAAQRLLGEWRVTHQDVCTCLLCQKTTAYFDRFVNRRGVDAQEAQEARQLALEVAG